MDTFCRGGKSDLGGFGGFGMILIIIATYVDT